MSTLEEFFANLDERLSLDEINKRMRDGENPQKIRAEVQKGLRIVGERFERKQYALIELEMAEELFRKCGKAIDTLSGDKYSEDNNLAKGMVEHSDTTDLG